MKSHPTPTRRTARLVALARWNSFSPRSSLLGMFAQEGQMRSESYRGGSGVTGKTPAPRYARTKRGRHKLKRRSANVLRQRNITLRSTTASFARAGLVMPDVEATLGRSGRSARRHQIHHRRMMGETVERPLNRRRARQHVASMQADLETSKMLERVQRLMRPSVLGGGIRTMMRKGA